MASFDETIEIAPGSPPGIASGFSVTSAVDILVTVFKSSRGIFHRDFARLKLTLGFWIFASNYPVLECVFAEIKDVGFTLPDCAWHLHKTTQN